MSLKDGMGPWRLLVWILLPITTSSFHSASFGSKIVISTSQYPSKHKLSSPPPHRRGKCQFAETSGDSSGAGGGGGDDDKFSFGQRIESVKSAAVGGLSGSICVAPVVALHDLLFDQYQINGLAQWEFDNDMAALQGALFSIVYRYCIRENDNNPMLNQGVVGAFVLIRTLSRVRTPSYCSPIPLECGGPLGYLDWSMVGQVLINGLESAVLFGTASAALEYCFERRWISKFP